MKRIGILSGAFDPVHEGHIQLALQAKEVAQLDKVFLLPERKLRRKVGVTEFKHRLAMCRLAAERYDWLEVLEVPHEQFTVKETLSELVNLFKASELVFVMGSDQFVHLPSWPDVEELVKKVSFVVSLREDDKEFHIKEISYKMGAEFKIVENPLPRLSSRKIREQLKAGNADGLSVAVLGYIQEVKLYG